MPGWGPDDPDCLEQPGLGLPTAGRVAALGHTVYLGARDPSHGEETAQAVGGRSGPSALPSRPPSAVTHAMLPLLGRSEAPVIVTVARSAPFRRVPGLSSRRCLARMLACMPAWSG
jgi:hypothetical protein